ncbi:hypothetical protein GQ55_9G052400 [Panicum hallii var. hallii]|uniref:A20-type domain-containing protein n=1 Tax=Panicum hallii var. hallii TaxID=1504633 RepID=A0A2T7BZZ1_9POAL|nr:hypothetical protein GQ55_9G052400 [Panicum hallii var. hallii]
MRVHIRLRLRSIDANKLAVSLRNERRVRPWRRRGRASTLTRSAPPPQPRGCGFFGNPATSGMCFKSCHRRRPPTRGRRCRMFSRRTLNICTTGMLSTKQRE